MEKEDFIKRLTELRVAKGQSARDMSLAMGQSPNYINNIENGKSLPSLQTFFYICEHFGITPMEFFDTRVKDPSKQNQLAEAAVGLSPSETEHLIAIIKDIKNKH